jgi:hypothetical protein
MHMNTKPKQPLIVKSLGEMLDQPTPAARPPEGAPERTIFREFALPLSAFNYLKNWQRDFQARHGVSINNNQALAIILREHQQQSGVSGEDRHGREASKAG